MIPSTALSATAKYRILGGVFALKSFTIRELSRFSGCSPITVRTVVSRHRDLIVEFATEPSGKRGGQPIRYKLRVESESVLEDFLRSLFPVARDRGVSRAPLDEERIESEASRYDAAAPSGLLVAEQQLGDMWHAAETVEDRRRLLSDAKDSLRAGRAEFDGWPDEERRTSLGKAVAASLTRVNELLFLHSAEVSRVSKVSERAEKVTLEAAGKEQEPVPVVPRKAIGSPLWGSERTALPGAHAIGPTDQSQIVEVSLVLKRRRPVQLDWNWPRVRILSHSEYSAQLGANPEDIEKVRQFASNSDLRVLECGDELQRRTVMLAGTTQAMERAFSVELCDYEHPEGSYRGYIGPIYLPIALNECVQAVFGLDDRPAAELHFCYHTRRGAFGSRATTPSYSPRRVAEMYDFPQDANASGQTIGIIEFGGGYRSADLKDYFRSLGLQAPRIKTVSVGHGMNRPSTPLGADGGVMLHIAVAASVAQGANIIVYFAENSERGFHEVVSTAIHDQLNRPSVILIGWGSAESTWTPAAIASFDQIAADAATLGITVIAATGDCGSSDGVNDGQNHVDFPASSPHVLACGGTRLIGSGNVIQSETVWNGGRQGGATGGGYSTLFARPAWQSAVVTQSMRGLPDVAGNADPETGYEILVAGERFVAGGTGAVAALWAGLIAVLNCKLNTRLGFLNPQLYSINQSAGFHDVGQGNNGAFSARPGWDPCTGLGPPDGTGLFGALAGSQSQIGSQENIERAHQYRVR